MRGEEVPVILWNSPDIGDSGDPPQQRCQNVSEKFQIYYNTGTLNYITTARRDGQVVACAAQGAGEPCSEVLFPLKSDEKNPKSALQRILRIRVPADGPISETDLRVYISLDKYLNGQYPSLDLTRIRTSGSQSENSPP
ncbi:MAG: COP23 domain-containing protein [Oscillatoria sp. Prado101]|nr:COP23 domain-containing protein [Oscillatoria sp. Prado101]